MTEVKFPLYRRFSAARISANNSMLALLAGSRLASHTLQLNLGSERLLPEIYPGVADIDRFNLVTGSARDLLNGADASLAAVAIPYALAVHEDFVVSAIDEVKTRGTTIPRVGRGVNAGTMHETLFLALGTQEPAPYLEFFHVVREMRNSHVHEGGIPNARLIERLGALSAAAVSQWTRIALQQPSAIVHEGHIVFTLGHLIMAFAVIKQLARDVNTALLTHWSRSEWLTIAVSDYGTVAGSHHNSSGWRRGIAGFMRMNYAALGFSSIELEAESRRLELWTHPAPW